MGQPYEGNKNRVLIILHLWKPLDSIREGLYSDIDA